MIVVALANVPVLISWLFYALLMGAFMGIAADGINGRRLGALIDERNSLSLARFQMASWTLVVLSAFLAAAIGNIRAGAPKPLDIVIPQEVWMLMGISTTSLVGAPLVLSTKLTSQPASDAAPQGGSSQPVAEEATPGPTGAGKTATAAPSGTQSPPEIPSARPLAAVSSRVASLLRQQGEDPSKLHVVGSLVVKSSVDDAAWSDLFKGDEVGDVATLDLAKVQMFFFTVVLILAYAVALGAKFSAVDAQRAELGPPPPGSIAANLTAGAHDPRLIDTFPPIQSGLVTLLGISNAGFLVNRAVPRTRPAG
jgi:hypothetical protein